MISNFDMANSKRTVYMCLHVACTMYRLDMNVFHTCFCKTHSTSSFKGAFNAFVIKFLAFVNFPFFVNSVLAPRVCLHIGHVAQLHLVVLPHYNVYFSCQSSLNLHSAMKCFMEFKHVRDLWTKSSNHNFDIY